MFSNVLGGYKNVTFGKKHESTVRFPDVFRG